MKILNPRLLCSSVCAFQAIKDDHVVDVTWTDLDNRLLQSCSGKLPSPQLLSVHAHRAVEHARIMRWVDKLDIPAVSSADAEILREYLVSQSKIASPEGSSDAAPIAPSATGGSEASESEGGSDTGSVVGGKAYSDGYEGSVSGSGTDG